MAALLLLNLLSIWVERQSSVWINSLLSCSLFFGVDFVFSYKDGLEPDLLEMFLAEGG